jgi:hypothetical protein
MAGRTQVGIEGWILVEIAGRAQEGTVAGFWYEWRAGSSGKLGLVHIGMVGWVQI